MLDTTIGRQKVGHLRCEAFIRLEKSSCLGSLKLSRKIMYALDKSVSCKTLMAEPLQCKVVYPMPWPGAYFSGLLKNQQPIFLFLPKHINETPVEQFIDQEPSSVSQIIKTYR